MFKYAKKGLIVLRGRINDLAEGPKQNSQTLLPVLYLLMLIASPLEAGSERDGWFSHTNGRFLLEKASQGMATKILSATLEEFPKWINGWTLQKMADLIWNIRPEPESEVVGFNLKGERESKMFDYGIDECGETYLIALRPFFETYDPIPTDLSIEWVSDIIQDIELKLLHEAMHPVWGFKEREATLYSENLYRRLTQNRFSGTSAQEYSEMSQVMRSFMHHLFKTARVPSVKELQFEKSWLCFEFDIRNESFVFRGSKQYEFCEAAGMVMNFIGDEVQNFWQSPTGWVGKRKNSTQTIRMTSERKLVMEHTNYLGIPESYELCHLEGSDE